MSHTSDEDLLGYTLGALDPQELERIDALIQSDPQLARAVEQIRQRLALLDGLAPPARPRAGLARRTCECIAAVPLDSATAAEVSPATASPSKAGFGSRRESLSFSRRVPLRNFAAIAAVVALLATVVIPALVRSRDASRLQACQNNIRTVGLSLLEHADLHGGRHLAIPEEDGKLGFAGIFAPMLLAEGLIDDASLFWCAGTGNGVGARIPTIEQLRAAEGMELVQLQRRAGGDFGFTLGQQVNGDYEPPANTGRSNFVLLADAPNPGKAARASSNHGGDGQNVFFEDGQTRFIATPVVNGGSIYENDWGEIGPGVHPDDSVVAASVTRILTSQSLIAE